MNNVDMAWVLWWKQFDNSGQGIMRVYEDEVRAKQDFELLEENPDRKYILDSVPFFKK